MSLPIDDETKRHGGYAAPSPEDLPEPVNDGLLKKSGTLYDAGFACEADSERFDAVVEAVLFASGEPLALERIAEIIERPADEVKTLLDRMGERLRNSRRGLLLRELSGKYQLCTRPEMSVYVNKLFEFRQKHALSQAAYETLSIVAYNANVTRAAIEKIRGVNSDSSISKLLERNLIVETGRASLPGRPMRYDVTDEFYRLFGFSSRTDLPDIDGGKGVDNGDNDGGEGVGNDIGDNDSGEGVGNDNGDSGYDEGDSGDDDGLDEVDSDNGISGSGI